MPINEETLKQIKIKKAKIIAEQIRDQIPEDYTSAEIKEMVEEISLDMEVVDMVMKELEAYFFPPKDPVMIPDKELEAYIFLPKDPVIDDDEPITYKREEHE